MNYALYTTPYTRRSTTSRRRGGIAAALIAVLAASAFAALTARPSRAVAANAPTTLSLPAPLDLPGLDTHIDVKQGQDVTITASGKANYGGEGDVCAGYPQTTPDGQRWIDGKPCAPKADYNAVLGTAPIGAAIARIGTGPWFEVGYHRTFTAATAGRIRILYNDVHSFYGDNAGAYRITIATGPTCVVSGFAGRPDRLQITVQGRSAGLASVSLVRATNAGLSVAAFTVGTTDPVIATATKTVGGQRAQVWLDIADVTGLHTKCDPVIQR